MTTDTPTFHAIPNAAEVEQILATPTETAADMLARVDQLIAERREARSAAARKGAATRKRNRARRGTA